MRLSNGISVARVGRLLLVAAFVSAGCSSDGAAAPGQATDGGARCVDDGICDAWQGEPCTCSECTGHVACVQGHTDPVVGEVQPFVADCSNFYATGPSFTVRNDGDVAVTIDRDRQYREDSPQPILFESVTVEPGATEAFIGTQFVWSNFKHPLSWTGDELHRFTTNDPDHARLEVNIPVSVRGVSIQAPATVDFGQVPVSTTKSMTISVSATGTAPGGYFRPNQTSGNEAVFKVIAASPADLYVPVDATTTISLEFTPRAPGCVSQEFTVGGGHNGSEPDDYLCDPITMTWTGCGT